MRSLHVTYYEIQLTHAHTYVRPGRAVAAAAADASTQVKLLGRELVGSSEGALIGGRGGVVSNHL